MCVCPETRVSNWKQEIEVYVFLLLTPKELKFHRSITKAVWPSSATLREMPTVSPVPNILSRWWRLPCQSLGAYWSPNANSIYKDTLWPACPLKTPESLPRVFRRPFQTLKALETRTSLSSSDHSASALWRCSGKSILQFMLLLLRRIHNPRVRNLVSVSVGSFRHFIGGQCVSERE